MIEILPESSGKLLGVRATDRLTDKDYLEVLIPGLEAVIKKYGKIRLLCFMDEGFDGFTPAAFWDDAKFFLPHKDDFEKMAIVGGRKWIDVMVKLFAHLMKGEVKTYSSEQLQEAWEWIRA